MLQPKSYAPCMHVEYTNLPKRQKQFLRVSSSKISKYLTFIVSKIYFINFNTSLYNTPNIKILLFYYFLFSFTSLSLPTNPLPLPTPVANIRCHHCPQPQPQPPPLTTTSTPNHQNKKIKK